MERTTEKAIKISELVKELETLKSEFGDVEVFLVNETEMVFDGIEKAAVAIMANTDEKVVLLVRGKVVLKP